MDYQCEDCGTSREIVDDGGMLIIKACGCKEEPKGGEEKEQAEKTQ